jgi:hypothetical protein
MSDCPHCGITFDCSLIGAGRKRKYCSAKCRESHRSVRMKERDSDGNTDPCANPNCGNRASFKSGKKLCRACYLCHLRTGRQRIPGDGTYFTSDGYRMVRAVGHPLARKAGYIPQHRKVAYEAHGAVCPSCFWCGISLAWATAAIDHLNEIKTDNRPINLVVSCHQCNRARGAMLPFLQRMRDEAVALFLGLVQDQAGARKKGAA